MALLWDTFGVFIMVCSFHAMRRAGTTFRPPLWLHPSPEFVTVFPSFPILSGEVSLAEPNQPWRRELEHDLFASRGAMALRISV
jgi:hypothetical protein